MKKINLLWIFALVLIITIPFTFADTLSETKPWLVSAWNYSQHSGNQVLDRIGRNHITLTGAPKNVTGLIGGANEFDGANDFGIIAGDSSHQLGNMTFLIWLNGTAIGQTGDRGIFDKGYQGGSTGAWGLIAQPATDNIFLFIEDDAGTSEILNSAVGGTEQDAPLCIAFTFNNQTKNATIYLNGTQDNSVIMAVNLGTDTNDIAVATRSSYACTGGHCLSADIDEAFLFNITLNKANISSICTNKYSASDYFQSGASSPDTTIPIVNATLNISQNSIRYGSILNISANITDETGLSFCQVIDNSTGSKTYTNTSLSGTADKCSKKFDITSIRNTVINFTVRTNDTNNNFRTNDTITTIADSAPTFEISINNTSPKINEIVKIASMTNDSDILSMVIASWNCSSAGIWLNISNSTSLDRGLNYTINASIGRVRGNTCGFLFYSNDSVVNTFTVSSLNTFVVADTSPDFTLAINNTSPNVNEVVRLSAVVNDSDILSMVIASWNGTNGIWINISNTTSLSAGVNYSVNRSVGLVRRNTVGWLFYANDSVVNTFTVSSLNTFVIADTTPSFTISTNNSAPKMNERLQVQSLTNDSDTLSMVIFSWNGSSSGIWINLSNSTASNVGLNYTVNATVGRARGSTIGYLFYANDSVVSTFTASSISTVVVANTAPNASNIANTTIITTRANLTLNISPANDSDNDIIYNLVFYNSSAGTVLLSNITTLNFTTNLTANANYSIFINSTDYFMSGFSTSSLYSFEFNTTPTSLPIFSSIQPSNDSSFSISGIQINITITDSNPDTAILFANFSGTFKKNQSSNYTSGARLSFNETNLQNGTYIFSIRANNTLGYENSTQNFTFSVDTSALAVTLVSPANNSRHYYQNGEAFSFQFQSTRTAACSLIFDGTLADSNSSVQKAETTSFKITSSQTADNMIWMVNCTDAENSKFNTSHFVSFLPILSGTGTTGGGGGGGGFSFFIPKNAASNTSQNTTGQIVIIFSARTNLKMQGKIYEPIIPVNFMMSYKEPKTLDTLKYLLDMEYAGSEEFSGIDIKGIRIIPLAVIITGTLLIIITLRLFRKIMSALSKYINS